MRHSHLQSHSLASDWIFVILALMVWVGISFDGRLHWDEPSYLYTATYVPWSHILYAGFEPSGINGFNVSRLGHLAIVKGLAALVGPGPWLVGAVLATYLLSLLGFAITAYFTLRLLMPQAQRVAPAIAIALFAPMMVYLAWKTVPDIPALLFSGLASLCWLRSLEKRTSFGLVLSALLLALTGMTKFILAWQFIALGLTLLLFGGYRWPWQRVLWQFLAVSLGALAIFGITLVTLQIPLSTFLGFLSVAKSAGEPLAAKLFKLLLTYGVFYLAIPLALWNRHQGLKWFMVAWLGLATVPFLITVPRLEVRYLVTSFMPLAGLVWLALDTLNSRARQSPNRGAALRNRIVAGLSSLAIIAAALLTQPFTAHEVHIFQLSKAIAKIKQAANNTDFSILIPWEYTDFHYLRVAYPELPIFNVYATPRLTPNQQHNWQQFQERYYGDRYLSHETAVLKIEGTHFYLGYRYTFPIENILGVVRSPWLGPLSAKLVGLIQSMAPLNHLEQSWLWHDPRARFQLVDEIGHYQVYTVTLGSTPTPSSSHR